MDPFDEFEFKPITEGLGFHKKTTKARLDTTNVIIGSRLPPIPPESKPRPTPFNQPEIQRPLFDTALTELDFEPTKSKKQTPYPPKPTFELPDLTSLENIKPTNTKATFTVNQTRLVDVNLPAVIFDSILVAGLVCLFTATVLLITQAELMRIIFSVPQDSMMVLCLGVLLLSVVELYLIISRGFFGRTLGEWAFDVYLGTKEQQQSIWYPFQVFWRSVVIAATGFILLPLISLLVGQDIPGVLSGVKLHSEY